MIIQIALLKLVYGNAETVDAARKALAGLEGRIPQLRHLEVGVDQVHSYRSYDLSLLARFESLEDLQHYQNHPAYVEVVKYLQGLRQSVVTVDYEIP